MYAKLILILYLGYLGIISVPLGILEISLHLGISKLKTEQALKILLIPWTLSKPPSAYRVNFMLNCVLRNDYLQRKQQSVARSGHGEATSQRWLCPLNPQEPWETVNTQFDSGERNGLCFFRKPATVSTDVNLFVPLCSRTVGDSLRVMFKVTSPVNHIWSMVGDVQLKELTSFFHFATPCFSAKNNIYEIRILDDHIIRYEREWLIIG